MCIAISLHPLPYHFNKHQGNLFFKCYTAYCREIQDSYFLNVVVLRKMHPGYNQWAKKNSESDIESSSIHEPISIFPTEITFYH